MLGRPNVGYTNSLGRSGTFSRVYGLIFPGYSGKIYNYEKKIYEKTSTYGSSGDSVGNIETF